MRQLLPISMWFVILLFFISTETFCQQKNPLKKIISGKVTHENKPLSDVNIRVKTKKTGTKTDELGKYNIRAEIGDILQYTYVGFDTINIVVEDVTSVLNIKMKAKTNILEEAYVVAKRDIGDVYDNIATKEITTAVGKLNPTIFPSTVRYFRGKDLPESFPDLRSALQSKMRNVPGIYDIDGVIYSRGAPPPNFAFSEIEDIYVITGSAGTLRWGGPVIIVRTIYNKEVIAEKRKITTEKYANQNFYSGDAMALDSMQNDFVSTVSQKEKEFKLIKGKVTFEKKPLTDVHIVSGKRTTKTDENGEYIIKGNIGDLISFSYLGYKTLNIIIEDVTEVLNVEMIPQVNLLDDALVKSSKKNKVLADAEKSLEEFNAGFGNFNPIALGSKFGYVDGKDIGPQYNSLSMALGGKYSGGIGLLWDVDGILYYKIEPPINLSTIISVHIVKGLAALTKYGPIGRDGVNIVRTYRDSNYLKKEQEKIAASHKNQNFYSNDAIRVDSSNVVATSILNKHIYEKLIKGKVIYAEKPLTDVQITSGENSTKSDEKGEYIINAKIGDMISFSQIGFSTINIIVEDITEELNIEMIPKVNILEESLVKSTRKKGKVLKQSEKADEEVNTAMGKFNPKKTGFKVHYIDGNDILPTYTSLGEALQGKYPARALNSIYAGTIRPLWDVDGMIYTSEPPIDINNIKDVHIIQSLAGTVKYGSLGRGGVIVVRTKYGSFDPKKPKIVEKFANQNYYFDDAKENNNDLNASSYIERLQSFNNNEEAFAYYHQILKKDISYYWDHLDIALYFQKKYDDDENFLSILEELRLKHKSNPEILKAIAYQYQTFGKKKVAIKTYQDIFNLRSKYAQSYRDLANAYVENEQFKKGWRFYMNYLFKGNDIAKSHIGKMLYSEMEWLYYVRSNQTEIKERFIPKNNTIKDFKNDVRIVIEWNTSEAEFDLEFVAPDKRAYSFEHSLERDEQLIIDEKRKGYSSKDFFIEDIGEGEWLMNLTYGGNKKLDPTYFKVTVYYHWGKPNQSQKITTYRLQDQTEKINLLTINKSILLAIK